MIDVKGTVFMVDENKEHIVLKKGKLRIVHPTDKFEIIKNGRVIRAKGFFLNGEEVFFRGDKAYITKIGEKPKFPAPKGSEETLKLRFLPKPGGFDCEVETDGKWMEQGQIFEPPVIGCDFVAPVAYEECRVESVERASGHGYQKEGKQTRFRVTPEDINQSAAAGFVCTP